MNGVQKVHWVKRSVLNDNGIAIPEVGHPKFGVLATHGADPKKKEGRLGEAKGAREQH